MALRDSFLSLILEAVQDFKNVLLSSEEGSKITNNCGVGLEIRTTISEIEKKRLIVKHVEIQNSIGTLVRDVVNNRACALDVVRTEIGSVMVADNYTLGFQGEDHWFVL